MTLHVIATGVAALHVVDIHDEVLVHRNDDTLTNTNVIVDNVRDVHEDSVSDRRLYWCMIHLSHNSITNVTYLSYCHRLRKLDLSNNCIINLPSKKVWKSLPALEVLYLHNNGVQSIYEVASLFVLEKLRILTLYGNAVSFHPTYRHIVCNGIASLWFLDHFIVSDEELIEGAEFGNEYRAMSDYMRFDLGLHIETQLSPSDMHEFTSAQLSALRREHHKCSAVITMQRVIRGFIARQHYRRYVNATRTLQQCVRQYLTDRHHVYPNSSETAQIYVGEGSGVSHLRTVLARLAHERGMPMVPHVVDTRYMAIRPDPEAPIIRGRISKSVEQRTNATSFVSTKRCNIRPRGYTHANCTTCNNTTNTKYPVLYRLTVPDHEFLVALMKECIATTDMYPSAVVHYTAAAVSIQSAWRSFVCRRQAQQKYERGVILERSCVLISRWWRETISRKRVECLSGLKLYASSIDSRDLYARSDIFSLLANEHSYGFARAAKLNAWFTYDENRQVLLLSSASDKERAFPKWIDEDTQLTANQIDRYDTERQSLLSLVEHNVTNEVVHDLSAMNVQWNDETEKLPQSQFTTDKLEKTPLVRLTFSSIEEARKRAVLLAMMSWEPRFHERHVVLMTKRQAMLCRTCTTESIGAERRLMFELFWTNMVFLAPVENNEFELESTHVQVDPIAPPSDEPNHHDDQDMSLGLCGYRVQLSDAVSPLEIARRVARVTMTESKYLSQLHCDRKISAKLNKHKYISPKDRNEAARGEVEERKKQAADAFRRHHKQILTNHKMTRHANLSLQRERVAYMQDIHKDRKNENEYERSMKMTETSRRNIRERLRHRVQQDMHDAERMERTKEIKKKRLVEHEAMLQRKRNRLEAMSFIRHRHSMQKAFHDGTHQREVEEERERHREMVVRLRQTRAEHREQSSVAVASYNATRNQVARLDRMERKKVLFQIYSEQYEKIQEEKMKRRELVKQRLLAKYEEHQATGRSRRQKRKPPAVAVIHQVDILEQLENLPTNGDTRRISN